MRLLADAFLADQAKVNRRGEGVQRFVGADVRGRLLAADVLLARGESENEAAAAFGVRRLSGFSFVSFERSIWPDSVKPISSTSRPRFFA